MKREMDSAASGAPKRPVKLKISNLTLGNHDYTYSLRASEFEDSTIDHALFPNPIQVTVVLTKSLTEIIAELDVKTDAVLECDRCLKALLKPIHGDYRIYFLLTADALTSAAGENDVRTLSKNDAYIDLTDDVRETLLLALPIRNVCEEACVALLPVQHEFHQTGGTASAMPEHTEESDWQKALKELNKKFNTN
jgi:uncharacterized protein